MCYRKKDIKNKVLPEHLTGFDKERIKAPCGCCPSCRKVKSNEWFVRGYFEFQDNNRKAFFVSLDFDNQHLPTWHGKPCFDSEIIKHFFYRLRYYVGKFRYLYATEYGGLMKRPHYHVLILPEKTIEHVDFFNSVSKCWHCGRHFDILNLGSSKDNLAALEYITQYTTKDITWNLDEFEEFQDMPLRFRPRTQASKGFGYSALEDGRITLDMIINGQKVAIPCGKNGKIVSFPIPRYYEMKVGYDYIWHKDQMKAELIKNEIGVKIAHSAHNRQYVYYVRSFFASRLNGIEPIGNGLSWYNTVLDCLDNFEDFKEFVYFRPFIRQWSGDTIIDSVRNQAFYRPNWQYYNKVCSYFDNWKIELDGSKCRLETEKFIESAKFRARQKIARNSQLRNYLLRKHFDFSQLY